MFWQFIEFTSEMDRKPPIIYPKHYNYEKPSVTKTVVTVAGLCLAYKGAKKIASSPEAKNAIIKGAIAGVTTAAIINARKRKS